MKSIIAICLLAAPLAFAAPAAKKTTAEVLAARNFEYTFEEYVQEFNKEYASLEEYAKRRDIFIANLETIKHHNSQPGVSFVMGLNEFADLTAEEFGQQTRGFDRSLSRQHNDLSEDEFDTFQRYHANDVPVSDLPASLDWREKGVVTPVKDQGMCGSCWAFSAAETMESAYAISSGHLVVLSEQELVDCVPNPNSCGGTGGCQGNTQWLAFAYTEAKGLTSETDYPYSARTGTCKIGFKPVVKNSGLVRIPKNNYTALMNAVANVGPISISAAAEPWQLYEGGIFTNKCNTDIDHGIQLVGYGEDEGKMYWLVRNSWGSNWGEEGYIRIERFGEGKEPCGEDNTPKDGSGCKGGPNEISVCGLCGIMSDSSYPTGVKAVTQQEA